MARRSKAGCSRDCVAGYAAKMPFGSPSFRARKETFAVTESASDIRLPELRTPGRDRNGNQRRTVCAFPVALTDGSGALLSRRDLKEELLRARIKREREDDRIKELERKKIEGELIDAEDVGAASQVRANAEREALLSWPRRIAADMAVELRNEERLVLQILRRYIQQHLTERASQPVTPQTQLELANYKRQI